MKCITCLAAMFLIPLTGLAQDAGDKQDMKQEKLQELLHNVQDAMELDPMMKGVMLTDGKFVSQRDMPGEEIQLQGKVMTPAQAEKVKEMVKNALGEDPYWREVEGPLTVSTEMMTPSQGSPQLADRYYAKGLTHFWDEEYAAADRAFSRAMAEAPQDLALKYWDVLTALAQDQNDRAKEKLTPLMAEDSLGSRSPNIATALERVQGPLRRKLMELENEILASM